MNGKVVIPVDGSAVSESAVPFAGLVARRTGAAVVLLRVLIEPEARTYASLTAAAESEAFIDSQLVGVRGILLQMNIEPRIVVERVPREGGQPAVAIAAVARAEGADLVVMGTHARSGASRITHPRVAESVVQASPCPVLLIPPGAPFDWTTARPFRVVIALDGSPSSEEILGPARELVHALGGDVALVRAVQPPKWWSMRGASRRANLEEAATQARTYLVEVADRSLGPETVGSMAVMVQDPARAILESARKSGARLIAMATRCRTGLAGMVDRSAARTVLRMSHTPMLLMGPGSASRVAA